MNDLFRPVRIGGLALKNRAVMPAMGTAYGTEKGEVSDRLLAYLRRRAEGGAGLIITEVCAVHPLGKGFSRGSSSFTTTPACAAWRSSRAPSGTRGRR